MKILKIKYCNEVWRCCFYLRSKFSEKEWHCRNPEIIEKLQDSRFISKHIVDKYGNSKNIKIPRWCPLENYKKPEMPIIMKGEHRKGEDIFGGPSDF